MVPGFFVTALTVTVLFAVVMPVLTLLAFRDAREHGEWPSEQGRS